MNGLQFIIYCIAILLFFIIVIIIPNSEGACSDLGIPGGAIEFAQEKVIQKDNVTFVSMKRNMFEGYCERHYWVTDTDGNNYRLVWSYMHNDIKLNTSYSIYYMDGAFNALWSYKI